MRPFLQAAPNPFRGFTEIGFAIDEPGPTSLAIYDATGRHVRTLVAGATLTAGRKSLIWDAADSSGRRVSAGVYIARLEVGNHQAMEKLLVIP